MKLKTIDLANLYAAEQVLSIGHVALLPSNATVVYQVADIIKLAAKVKEALQP